MQTRSAMGTATRPVETRVISLLRRPDRRQVMQAKLESAGIAWEWFDAVDAASAEPAQLSRHFPRMSRSYPCAPAEMACAISHRLCWEEFLSGSGQALCVLEDDVEFEPELAGLLADDGWVTPAAGLVKLDRNAPRAKKMLVSDSALPQPLPGRRLVRLWSRALGGGGYVAHRDTVARMAANFDGFAAPIDHHLFNPAFAPHFRAPGVHRLTPAVIFHHHAGSDIEPSRQSQREATDWNRVRLAREALSMRAIPGRLAALWRGARFEKLL
ncbi:glycosyltransferase family 25 protein [Limimaricola pyoseonensis]|uniref:Glycosyl transferase, family 25 n=1 Tax=Limimaricola pyoseonensis TaxID=521013 RepID=A0A1G7CHB9_9RHOB|nr:glycosyltransferase family 25 protein [Limimaricola pyoseonensis]SDE38748.1 glycosyl transferase, family 25 [Limimaricola pyoseonensis]